MEKARQRESIAQETRFNEGAINQAFEPFNQLSVQRLSEYQLFLSNYQIIVLIPVYNEAKYIVPLIARILKYPVRIIVINDGSTDNTTLVSRQMGVMVIDLPENYGKGTALNYGFFQAVKLNPDAIVTIDGDGQHFPEEMPQLLIPILDGKADITIGSRYLNAHPKIPVERRLGHYLLNFITNTASGVYVSDSQSGFRAFSPRAYRKIQFLSKGFSVESELQFVVGRQNLRVMEIPITVSYHLPKKRSIFFQGFEVLSGVFDLMVRYRAQLFYRFHGLIFFLLGLLMGFLSFRQFDYSQYLAKAYILMSILATAAGVVVLSEGITKASIKGLIVDAANKVRKNRNDN